VRSGSFINHQSVNRFDVQCDVLDAVPAYAWARQ
jgi:hypothetical protein